MNDRIILFVSGEVRLSALKNIGKRNLWKSFSINSYIEYKSIAESPNRENKTRIRAKRTKDNNNNNKIIELKVMNERKKVIIASDTALIIGV